MRQNAYRILMEKSPVKLPIGRPRKSDVNVKTYHGQRSCVDGRRWNWLRIVSSEDFVDFAKLNHALIYEVAVYNFV